MADTPAAPDAPETEVAPDTPETPTDAPDTGTRDEGATEAPEVTEPDTNWEKRYNDLRPEYDRQAQFLASVEGRHGPDAQKEAYQLMGLELADEEPETDEEYTDPEDEIREIKDFLANQQEQAQEAEMAQAEQTWLDQELQGIQKKDSVEFDQREKELLIADACSHRFEDGQPDIEGAAQRLNEAYAAREKRLIDSKRNAPVPGLGTAGDKNLDLSNADIRQKAMADAMNAAEGSEQ